MLPGDASCFSWCLVGRRPRVATRSLFHDVQHMAERKETQEQDQTAGPARLGEGGGGGGGSAGGLLAQGRNLGKGV